ncbi:inositol polyphosphate 5-phosphatase E isoform X2 [Macrosteles quadrilineatus]|uniref:inositol polyphosphate 5-phosphatase E isoform X2 n=1 Tax=Macrosteles quadrilineatus TaxID=74068 RepID=UPI0023E0D30F|nr:inositol polyphosphate 5-phosphatase E isoform X2 [Macrosteles quadrilineatus]
MEEEEKSDPETTPLKTKKKGFCSLLNLRKKKVGCLPLSSDASQDDSPGPSTSASPLHKTVFDLPSPPRLNKSVSEEHPSENDELKRCDAVAKSHSSTNVALCCAITESSRTPVHFQSNFKFHYNNNLSTMSINRSSILTRMNGRSEELSEGLPPTGLDPGKLKKPASETNIVASAKRADSFRKCLFSRTKKTHKRSFSLGKSTFSEEKPKDADSGNVECSLSASEVSPQSSPSPVEASHARLRRRLLLSQRRSVDNIVASSSGSGSPGSTRSADSKESTGKKKKARPSSVVVTGTRDKSKDKSPAKQDVSMESLVRQSLLAAQVFHLIPTTKARERNFLHGRIAATSLLGTLELERVLPTRELHICVVTWNMNGQAPPTELNCLVLPEGLDHLPDILAVGTQESYPERFQWEVGVQETLGPSHVLFHSANLGTLHLAVYLRRDLLWFCSVPEDDSFSTRPGTAFRTKGAVAVGFSVFGTSLMFITAHLTAHQEKVKERLQDIKRIAKSLELPKNLPVKHKSKDVTQNYDCVFWSGDLNFRLTPPREEVMSWINKQKFPLTSPSLGCLADQLTTSIVDGTVFRGFEEGPLTFAPTYKYDPGTSTYDTSHKQRTPSYTDRILFRSRRHNTESTAVECVAYASVPEVCTSDHKPVWGLYKVPVRPGLDTIPLAAGMFNREVYLEAIKRRAAAMDLTDGASTFCTIQ